MRAVIRSAPRKRSKKRRRAETQLVTHTAEFSVLLELLLVALPPLFAHAGVSAPAGIDTSFDSDAALLAQCIQTVASLVSVADSMRVYVVNDDVAPHPQFRCLAALADTILRCLRASTHWCVAAAPSA